MRASRLALTVLVLLIWEVDVAAAQELGIRPVVLLEEDPAFGVHITAEMTRDRVLIGPYPKNFFWAAAVDAPLFTKSERNPEPLRARLDGGLQISLFRPSTPVGAAPSPDDPPPWNYGYVAFQLGVGAEAPQDVNMADVTVGGSFAYEHDQYHSLWFIPELRVAYDAVFCIDCDLTFIADGLNTDDTGWRLGGELGWNIPADRAWVPALLKPIWLRLDGRAFHTSGLDTYDERHNDDGLWGSAELAYRCDRCGPVHEVYVRGNGGRLPQRLREKRAWTAGVSLAF
jgi:hypothetical protein